MELTGLHHVTAVTAKARENLSFYTEVLGLRLVKKTVNQDDVSAYHLFYGDEIGSPGTEVTFFDWPAAGPNRPGVGAISTIALSVPPGTVDWWADRLHSFGVAVKEERSILGFSALDFQDPEGQSLRIVGDPASGVPWKLSPVPVEQGIRGMHHVTLTVRNPSTISRVLVDILGMSLVDQYEEGQHTAQVFELGSGGAGKQVHVVESDYTSLVRVGAGGVHHVAFRTPDAEQQAAWLDRIQSSGLHVSSVIDRYYFRSIYFREPGGILFEIATDGPGFAADEDSAYLGQRLSLPPFLEPRRASIEAGLLPL